MIPYKLALVNLNRRSRFIRFFKMPCADVQRIPPSERVATFALGDSRSTTRFQHAIVQVFNPSDQNPEFYKIDNRLTIYCKLAKTKGNPNKRILSSIHNMAGRRVADITYDPVNKVIHLPFSVDEVIENFLFEHYVKSKIVTGLLRRYYYVVRSYMPKKLQMSFRRGFLRRQFATLSKSGDFPAWPVEHSLIEFMNYILRLIVMVSKNGSIAVLPFWPDGSDFCVVLTHDVDSAEGFESILALAHLEREHGFRSSFNIVPELYSIDDAVVAEVRNEGFEIGLHGLYHDGKLFDSQNQFCKRAAKINEYAKQWKVGGFRSPATYRNPALLPRLCVEYDSTYIDTAAHEPQPGGCCSIFPYFIEHLVELPITVPQDHTLFNILGQTTPGIWLEKISEIQRYNGMVLMDTHTDYFHINGWQRNYVTVLRHLRGKKNFWHALPIEVARWWKFRDGLEITEKQGAQKLNVNVDSLKVRRATLQDDNLVITDC